MDEAMKQVVDALKSSTEFLVFRGKLDQQSDREIARRVERGLVAGFELGTRDADPSLGVMLQVA